MMFTQPWPNYHIFIVGKHIGQAGLGSEKLWLAKRVAITFQVYKLMTSCSTQVVRQTLHTCVNKKFQNSLARYYMDGG